MRRRLLALAVWLVVCELVVPTSQDALSVAEQSPICASQFDVALWRSWWADREAYCTGSSSGAMLQCSSKRLPNLPHPTGPHVLCEAEQLVVDFDRLRAADCPKFRPGWMCAGDHSYYRYDEGALQLGCARRATFDNKKFPRDHLRDVFASVETDAALPQTLSRVDGVTMFITREKGEHINLFHTMTDYLNAFGTMFTMGIEPSEVQVVLMDDHSAGPLDPIWELCFSLRRPLRRARDFISSAHLFSMRRAQPPPPVGNGEKGGGVLNDKASFVHRVSVDESSHQPWAVQKGSPVLFERAVFSPPGYTSVFYAHNKTPTSSCAQRLLLLRGFVAHILKHLNVQVWRPEGGSAGSVATTLLLALPPALSQPPLSDPPVYNLLPADMRRASQSTPRDRLRILFVSRRPYDQGHRMYGHKYIGRQIANEDELIAAMEDTNGPLGGLVEVVTLVDFGRMDLPTQVQTVHAHDLMIGMHGAGLSHELFLPDWAGVLELRPPRKSGWWCFKHMAEWRGLRYSSWSNDRNPALFRKDKAGDYTTVPTDEFMRKLLPLAAAVLKAKMDYGNNSD